MKPDMKILYEGGTGEIEEKKSRFIATTFPVSSQEEAIRFIEQTKKKYWDARHNCYAYVCGEHQQISRCSDDGEPSGTAGRPMLDVLLGEELHDILVVVTRYFGGTLLGTGGLVRAYSQSVKEGLKNSVILTKQFGKRVRLLCSYSDSGRLQYLLASHNIAILAEDYSESVSFDVLIPEALISQLTEELIDGTGGRVQIEERGDCDFAVYEKEVLLL